MKNKTLARLILCAGFGLGIVGKAKAEFLFAGNSTQITNNYGRRGYWDAGYGGTDYYDGNDRDSRAEKFVELVKKFIEKIDCPIYELKGRRIIRHYLRRRKIVYKINRPLRINNKAIRVDFLLKNNIVIEYWSLDKDEKNLMKKDFYKEYKKAGGKVYFIGPKDTEDPTTIKQDLDNILEKITKRERKH